MSLIYSPLKIQTMSPNRNSILPFLLLTTASFFMISCQKKTFKPTSDEQPIVQSSPNSSSVSISQEGATTRTVNFGPTANLFSCLGYNVKFNGEPVVLTETAVKDENGNVQSYTRHWTVKGVTAKAVYPNGADYPNTTNRINFDVVAGAEMFSIKDPNTTTGTPNAVLSGDVFIHQGTIVLENTATGERVVIRHQVLKVPGQGDNPFRSGWYIQGQKCGS
jgi:hypothetical protein